MTMKISRAKLANLEDGVYEITMYGGIHYRAEKRKGVWFFADGTGWSAPVDFPMEITNAKPMKESK